jgi:hypothetical protein
MNPKIILDTNSLRPDRLCPVCRLPLVTDHQPLVIASVGTIAKSRDLLTYHASCHDILLGRTANSK